MPERPSDPAEPRSHRGGPLVTALRALLAIAVFLSVVRVLDNEFGPAGAVVGGAAVGLLACLITPWASRRRCQMVCVRPQPSLGVSRTHGY